MDQDASSEGEDLNADLHNFDETCRLLQARSEKRLQKVKSARAAENEDIELKKLALQELKAKHNEELQPLEAALQSGHARKRKHEEEIQQLEHRISDFKSWKPNSEELPAEVQPETHQTSAPTILTHNSKKRAVKEPGSKIDGAPQGRTSSSRVTQPATIFEKDLRAHTLPKSHNDPIQLRTDEYSDQDELSNSSYFEGQSDEEFTAQDGKFKGTGDAFVPNTQSQHLTQKRIPYEEVYEMARDPQANRKHWIINYPPGSDNWYILRCKRHDLNWFSNPLPAAGKHISASNHKCSTGNANSAIKELGELVEDCNQQKAEASNAEYSKAVAKGYKPKNTMNAKPSRERQKTKSSEPTNGSAQTSDHEPAGVFRGVIDPAVGKVYHAWWNGEPGEPSLWYPVVILPYSGDCDWKEVGLTGNIFTSGLGKEIPTCFKTVKVAKGAEEKSLRLTWAEDYEDRGPEVRSRKFPCLFLHPPLEIPNAGEEIVLGPQDELLAFLPAKDLRHQSTDLPSPLCYAALDAYKGLVQAFQARLEAIRAKQNAASEQEAGKAFCAQASPARGQQQPDATVSAKVLGLPDTFPRYDDQELHPSIEHNLPMPGHGRRDGSDDYGLDAQDPRESLQVQLKNNSGGRFHNVQSADLDQRANMSTNRSVTSTTSSTHRPSPNGREGSHSNAEPWASQVASRQVQLMGSESQNVSSPFALQQSSSQRPRAASAIPGGTRGPTALRPIQPLIETEKRSDGPIQQDKSSGLRKAVNTADRDAVPKSAGHTSWGSPYPQPWRSPDTGGRRPENQ